MASKQQWKSVIRFKDAQGRVRYGEPTVDLKKATLLEGDDVCNLSFKTREVVDVAEILAPHTPDTILCIGLNYKEHAKEGKMPLPKVPIMFHKSKSTITGPYASITMPPQAGNIDYENELAFVVSRDAKDVSASQAHEYILGYTVANDVSSRKQQTDLSMSSFAKSFDDFCPIGPVIVSAEVVGDPQSLKIVTRRNGEVVQSSSTSDMIFGVYELLAFLSQGTTVPAGTLVVTGTPPGVIMFSSDPLNFLKAGEVVECEIEKIGCLRNTFVD